MRRPPESAVAKALLALLALLVSAQHVAAVFAESINWDEFGILDFATLTHRTGTLHNAGRFGLVVVALLPFVTECLDEIRAVHAARLLWAGITILWVAGLFELLRRLLLRHREHSWHDAALGVALLVMVPIFLRWSIQVRTDQVALAAATWGGVCLLASRRRIWLAAVAGLLLGVSGLANPKVIYVVVLVCVLGLADLLLDAAWSWKREGQRAGLVLVCGGLTIGAYLVLVPIFFTPRPIVSIASSMNTFEYYRLVLGMRVYRGMLPTLVPHGLMASLLVMATAGLFLGRVKRSRELALAWVVVALGFGVMRFHAAALPYFWMTLGVFPAVAGALALGPIRELVPQGLARRAVFLGLWGLLVLPGIPAAIDLLDDTQRPQRLALDFVKRNADELGRGFHPERANFCAREREPFRVYFTQQILTLFRGPEGPRNIDAFLDEFRQRPVSYLIHSYRLEQFPERIQQFWAGHYVLYATDVYIAGASFAGPAGATRDIDIIVAARYRWHAPQAAAIEVNGTRLAPGDTIDLSRGTHTLTAVSPVPAGTLTLALDEPPAAVLEPFYAAPMMQEYRGIR